MTFIKNEIIKAFFEVKKDLPAYVFVIIMFSGALLFFMGAYLDPRDLMSEKLAWHRLSIVSISFSVFILTLKRYLSFFNKDDFSHKGVMNFAWISLSLTYVFFFLQKVRGIDGHYQYGTFIDEYSWYFMGIGVYNIFFLSIYLIFQTFTKEIRLSYAESILFKASLLLFALGCFQGNFMYLSSHHLNPPFSFGNKIWYLGWNLEVGDFRPSHFLGIHSLQLIPLLYVFINNFIKNQLKSVSLSIFIYWSAFLLMTFNALRGKPFYWIF